MDLQGWEIFAITALPVVGAEVNLRAAATAQPNTGPVLATTTTGANGQWSFTGLAVTDYDIDVSYAGKAWTYKGLTKFVGSITAESLPTQAANTLLAGPTSGVAAKPTARLMVEADIPNGLMATGSKFAVQAANRLLVGPASGADATPGYRAMVEADIPNGLLSGGSKFAAQLANLFLAGPASGAANTPGYRGIAQADLHDVVPGTWVPTASQNVAITVTVGYAKYWRLGKLVLALCGLSITSAGTLGSIVRVTAPVAAAAGSPVLGMFSYQDTGLSFYIGATQLDLGTLVGMAHQGANYIGAVPSFAAASGDGIQIFALYEAA